MKKITLCSVLVLLMSVFGVQASYYDFGGATITIIDPQDHPAQRFIEGEWPGVPRDGTAYGLHEEAEALFNCKIEFMITGWTEYFTVLPTRVISGDADNDLWLTTSGHFWALLAQGMLYPVGEILSDEYFDGLPPMSRAMTEYMSYRGTRYSFGAAGPSPLVGVHTVVYNKDVFEEQGLPDLQELYEAGEWTWDKMEEIATAATRTVDDLEQPGMAGAAHEAVFYGLAYTNNRSSYVQEVDGRVTFTGNSPEFLESFARVQEWIGAKIMSGTRLINNHALDLIAGRHAMILTDLFRVGMVLGQAQEARLGYVPFPKGPGMEEHIITSMSSRGAFALPVTAAHPEGMVQLAQFLYPPDDYDFVLSELVQTYAQDRRSAAILMELHDNWSGYTAPMRQFAGMDATHIAVRQVLGGSSAAAAMGEIAGSQQEALDELWN